MATPEEATGQCPICQLELPIPELEPHAQTHFGLTQNPDDPILIDDDAPSVSCLHCGADIPLDQYASHEAAHRYGVTSDLHSMYIVSRKLKDDICTIL